MVRTNDPFWNDVEDMNDGSMKCKFCGHLFAKGTSISRINWHLSGETGHGVGICGQVPKEVQEAAFLAMHRGNKRHKSIPSSSNVNDYAIPTCPQEQDNAGDAGRMQVGVQGMENTGEGSFQHVDRSVSPSRLGVDAHENREEAAQGTDVVNQLAGGTWAQIFSEAQKLNEINLMLEEEIESTDEEAVKMISLGGKFERVSYLPARRGIGDRSVKDYEAFESRRHVLDEILEALKDNDVNLVGVYGMAGVGKTTIVKKVAEQVKANRIFDVVVLAVVSKTPDLRRIQEEIADGLGFKFEAETDRVRAERLRERLERETKGLERETKVLVILDDIWERLELDDVGIPSGSDYRGCKILMTSRDRKALYRMDTKKLFHLQVLVENEAWNLFKNMAGDAIKNPDLKPVAVQVAKRCAGLPILLVTVASALKDGDLSEWKDALKRLERFDKDGIHSPVNSALELSYTSLKGEEIKSVFLLCGQLAPHHIPIHDLLKYTVGLGLFKRISTLDEARHRLNKLVNDLIACCLLEGGAGGSWVKMHDVLHGFAASVASRDHHVFALSPGSVLREWPAKDMLEQYSAISLPNCKISGLPEVLNCPKMQSFILYNVDPSLKIPDCLFEGTKTLQLMDMTRVQLPTLPSSLQFLEKLQTLCLGGCGLGDIALIGELKMLKVLSLIGSNIDRLPREIRQLTRLQLLDLTDNPTLEIIPPNVLSCLTQLEDLYMENSFLQWGVEGLDSPRNNASLAELKNLPFLSTLYLHITDPMILPKDFFSKKLERFNILIGEGWEWSSKRETSTIMKLKISASIQSEEGIQLLLKRTEDLHLDGLEGVKSVSYELDGQGFPSLKHLHIQNSLEIRYIVDSTMLSPIVDFPFLVSLSLDNLNKLEKICNGQPVAESFSKLRILKVKSCPMLKNLFSLHMQRGFLQLEEINIIDCEIMEVIVAEESGGEADEDEAIKLTQLRTLTLEYLPQFTSVSSKSNAASISQTRPEPLITDVRSNEIASDTGLQTPMTLFNKKIEFPNLEDLKLSSIEVEKIWQDQPGELSYWFVNGYKKKYWFVRLTSLIVEGCRNLKYLFTTSMVESLAQLKRLELCDCVSMEEIIIKNGLGGEENVRGVMLPKLQFLKLKGLPNLTRFCTGHLIQCFFLQQLWIEDCPALKTFISNSLSTDAVANNQFEETNSTLFDEKVAFSNIEELRILGMDNLNMIWHTEFHSDSFCKLKVLMVKQGDKLLNIFPPNMLRRFQNLEHLVVDYCALLEEVFDLRSLMNEKESHAVTAFKLKNMYVWNLQKLKKVWNTNPHGILSFQNLHLVSARNCPSLKSLFPASVALGLPQLEGLKLNNCGVEEIVAEEERLGEAPKFVFPKTSSFILWDLPKLKSFYPGRHTSEWPVLKKIEVYLCNEVPVFDLEQDQLGIQIQQPLFSFEKVIPNLEELRLDVKDAVKICQGQFSADLFHKVRVLALRCFDYASAEFPFGILHRFQNMEKLVVGIGYLKELFPCQLVDEEEHTLARIRCLKLINLPNLEKIWNQDLRVDQLLQNLETLEVNFCGSLINLAPSASSFGNLTALHVRGCKALKYLVTSSTAISLVQLSVMSIKECKMVTEIVASNGDEAGNEIIFRKLESLKLDCLASLTSFCSVDFTFRFPCLTEVIVTNCPKMKTFSLGILSTPRLQKVWQSEEKDKGHWKRDLKSFYPGRHTSEWPVLKKLDVYLCDEVPVFDPELQSTQGACTQDQLGMEVQQPLFSFEKMEGAPRSFVDDNVSLTSNQLDFDTLMSELPPSFPQTMVKRAGTRDPFWNYVEEKNDGSMSCMFCQHRWANKIPISRFKWHLSGEESRGVAICGGVTKEVQEEALKDMRGSNKRHKSTASSINVNDHGISTCPQEQNIKNENMGGDIRRVIREVQVVEVGVEDERISSHAVAGNDVVSMTGMRAQEHRVSEGALEIRLGIEPVDRALEQSTTVLGNLAGSAGRTQVGVQGMEQGVGEERIQSHLQAKNDMEDIGEESSGHDAFQTIPRAEQVHDVAICPSVNKEVQEGTLKAMPGGNKRHKSIACSINVNDRGISTCPQEQKIENENMGGDIGRVLREVQVVDTRTEQVHNVQDMIRVRTEPVEESGRSAVQAGAGSNKTRGVPFPTSSNTLVGQAFEENRKVIWSLLMDDEVQTIGIYGMRGVGKTTLLQHISNELLQRPDICDHVWWVTVSQDFSINRLQNLIAKHLHLDLSSEDDDLHRAAKLSEELRKKQKWILILDDLWNSFELHDVGIHSSLKGCKLILTTRSQKICAQIDCQHKIELKPLLEGESWTLFKENLGPHIALSDEVEGTAKAVAGECAGLPLGIITIARSLRGVDDLPEWRTTLMKLRELKVRDMDEKVFRLLRFSYDRLVNDSALQQVGDQGLEQGAEEELICLHPEAESGMENTCAEYIQHVDRNDFLEETRLMESTSGRLVQPGTSASSTKLVGRAFEKNVIWSCLMDDKVSIIGIYGMGGNGKTVMLKNICNELLERHDISHSIYWVNVPQDFRIDRSQDLIAKRLDFKLSSKDDDLCRVVELGKELMMKQKWILILNDLWNSFDPQELGIPIPLNGSKFIMTTRSKMVCQQMNCQNSIRVDRLSDEEALTLFMEKLGHERQLSEEEKQIVVDVVRECDGLPLGIVTLAESLKGVHELHKWKITLKRLKESNFWEMEDQIFQILRLSYDCLDYSTKQCFVYCALFDESQKIERRELIESFIKEGIIKEFDKGQSILDSLENVCLLERIDDGKAVKMHDLLRDMAIQILDDEYSLDMAKEERG